VRPWSLFSLCFVLALGCSQTNDLPQTTEAAFNVPAVPPNARRFTRTFVVNATRRDAIKAADEALAAVGFEQKSDDSSDERRCGHRLTGWYDWAVWGCFYFLPAGNGNSLTGRVITEEWRSFGLSSRQEWESFLAAAFQNSLEKIHPTTRTE
jgi:hypothetical protein